MAGSWPSLIAGLWLANAGHFNIYISPLHPFIFALHLFIFLDRDSINMASIFSLEGHTAMITGCTRGIGQAVAVGMAEAGADIILIQVAAPIKDINISPC